MRQVQFSVRCVFVAVALIAGGFAVAAGVIRREHVSPQWGLPALLLSGALVGAGITAPFRHWLLGATLGILLTVLATVVLIDIAVTNFYAELHRRAANAAVSSAPTSAPQQTLPSGNP